MIIDLSLGEKVTIRVAGGEILVMNLRGGGGVTMVEQEGVRVEYREVANAGIDPTHVYHDLGFHVAHEHEHDIEIVREQDGTQEVVATAHDEHEALRTVGELVDHAGTYDVEAAFFSRKRETD